MQLLFGGILNSVRLTQFGRTGAILTLLFALALVVRYIPAASREFWSPFAAAVILSTTCAVTTCACAGEWPSLNLLKQAAFTAVQAVAYAKTLKWLNERLAASGKSL